MTMMRQRPIVGKLLMIMVLIFSAMTADAAYIVKGVTGNVKLISGGKSTELKEGM